jgi:hypothetical protein
MLANCSHALYSGSKRAMTHLLVLTDYSCSLYSGTNGLLRCCSFSASPTSSSLHAAACLNVSTDCSPDLVSGFKSLLHHWSFSASLTPGLVRKNLQLSALCAKCKALELAPTITSNMVGPHTNMVAPPLRFFDVHTVYIHL